MITQNRFNTNNATFTRLPSLDKHPQTQAYERGITLDLREFMLRCIRSRIDHVFCLYLK